MSGGRGPRLYAASTRIIALAMIALGLAILVRALALGGGPLSFGVVVGLALAAIGCGRLWLAQKMGSKR